MTEKSESNTDVKSDYGFDLYPERRSDKKRTFYDSVFGNNYSYNHSICEANVFQEMKSNPLVKVLIAGLKKAGCPINLRRHIVCEECSDRVTGGYDTEFNQLIVCQNSFKVRNSVGAVLIHELIHMYDNCVGKVDFKNLEHLACTEIRAANISHCSFLSSVLLGQSSPFNIKKTHQYCVKIKAAQSMMLARNLDYPTALNYVIKVFDKCYNDLEPVGRRIRRNSQDPTLILRETKYYELFDNPS